MNVNKTFLNHYILHPLEAPSKRRKVLYIIGSLALAIFCLGHFHRKAKALTERNWTDLSPQAIARMTPDEQGALIERFPLLSPQQLQAMLLKPKNPEHNPQIISKQGDRKALCGLYAINNAFQSVTMTEEAFSQDIIALITAQFGEGVFSPDEEIDTDPTFLREILKNRLKTPTEVIELKSALGTQSKQEALSKLLEKKDWAIAYHQADTYRMPCAGKATYNFSTGHFVALRKDQDNNWWYIDSRFPSPSCIPLALIPRDCVLIVPQ